MYKICAVFEPSRHLLPDVGIKFNGAVTRRRCFHICRNLPYLQKPTIFVKWAPINWNRVAQRCIISQTKQRTFGPLKHLKTVKIELYFSDRTLNHVSNGISRGMPCLRRQVLEENRFAIAIKILGRLFDVAALLIVSEIYLRSDRSSERCIYTSAHRTRRRWRRGNVTNPQLTGKLDNAVCFLTAARCNLLILHLFCFQDVDELINRTLPSSIKFSQDLKLDEALSKFWLKIYNHMHVAYMSLSFAALLMPTYLSNCLYAWKDEYFEQRSKPVMRKHIFDENLFSALKLRFKSWTIKKDVKYFFVRRVARGAFVPGNYANNASNV